MAWLIGIDEAGYGPNLGPLVMTLVACRVPDEHAQGDLWSLLRGAVRRHGEPADSRPVVADSKLVYSTATGLAQLERTVLGLLPATMLQPLLESLSPDALPELCAEPWFTGTTALPMDAEPDTIAAARQCLNGGCGPVQIAYCRSAIFCPPRFNAILDRWGSKAAALSLGLTHLLGEAMSATAAEPTRITVDKHGGRNQYAAILQEAFPDGYVRVVAEGREQSVYQVDGLDRQAEVTLMPRADVEHLPVALASMVSKYMREALMHEFNVFWRLHLPDLKPTAGYPGDAARFLADIRPTLLKLGLDEGKLWRRK